MSILSGRFQGNYPVSHSIFYIGFGMCITNYLLISNLSRQEQSYLYLRERNTRDLRFQDLDIDVVTPQCFGSPTLRRMIGFYVREARPTNFFVRHSSQKVYGPQYFQGPTEMFCCLLKSYKKINFR